MLETISFSDYCQGYFNTEEDKQNNQKPAVESIQFASQEEQIMKYRGISIHKNKNCDTWYTRFRMNGKQYYISARTQKECYNKLKKKLAEGIPQETTQTYTLIEWYNKWLELYKIGKVKENTLRNYQGLLGHIPKETQVQDIKTIRLEQIIEMLNNCKGGRQKQNLYELFNALFQKAMDNDIIEKNIVKRIEKPQHEKTHSQALTNAQQREFIKICNDIPNGDLLLVGMYQGLRRGEILGLTIDNLDFDNNTLTINKGWGRNNQFDTTKNKQSMRTMPMFEQTKQILLKYKNKSNRIFELSNGQYERLIQEVKNKSNIKNFKYKDMRATFITRCKELNIPKHIIQSWVGHIIGSNVTDTVYTRHNTDVDDKYINILNTTKFYSNSTQQKK